MAMTYDQKTSAWFNNYELNNFFQIIATLNDDANVGGPGEQPLACSI